MSTEVIIQQNGKRPLYRKLVRDGIAGNYDVIFEMVRMVRASVDYDLGIEAVAKTILTNNNLDSNSDPRDQLKAVFNFVVANVKYIQDLSGHIESLKDARATLRDGWGDCDDQTILNATLLGCLGFENVKIAMAKYAKDEDTFAHVYCVCYVGDERYVLDTTLPTARFDREIKTTETKEIPVFQDIKGFDGFGGAYNHARHHARKLARFTVRAIPSAVNVLPLGFLAGGALATGASLVDNATMQSLSLSATASNINAELDKIISDLLFSRIAYDLAKTQALQLAAQLAAVEINSNDAYVFDVVRTSIKNKLEFINKFPAYAQTNNIKLVYLDSTKMLCAGLILAAGTGYVLYRGYKNSRSIF